ncbi:MAG: adenylate/guanylate cyclase domain-containing protein [Maribacter sp.]|nr:adenylate/guanylate cyclase domain-containing protein [Maribacter sp.]
MGFQYLGSFAQDQNVADSLSKIYKENNLEGTAKLELLRNLSFNEVNDLALSLKYAEELISLSILEENDLYLHRGYYQKGIVNRLTGDLDKALKVLFKSAEAAIDASYVIGEGHTYIAIADTYSEIGNSDNAESYYNKGIQLLRSTNDPVSLATALLNAGDEAFNSKKYDVALAYFEESGDIFRNANYLIGTAYNKGNIGMVHAEQGRDSLAKANINEAIIILEELEDYSPIAEYLTYISDIYLKQDDWPTALGYTERSLELAKKYGLKKQISESNLQLSELYDQIGDPVKSYTYYKEYIAYRDSVINLEKVQQFADLRTNYEVSQKQTEVDLLNQQKRNQRIILGFSGLLLISLFWYYRTISKEKKRSEALLLNILPAETARELKEKGKVKAKKIASATVLFTDFKGFTTYSEKLSPEALVETVGFYFSKFDAIIEKHGLEKIKTIGDAYMCAGGLHADEKDHAQRMVLAGLEIAAFVEATKNDVSAVERSFDIRLGINTGPVVAGVVGTKKFAYDIWGDTVNVASRMETLSEPGKINISESTYDLVKDTWVCEYRGEIEVKNRGALKMYFVNA